MAKYKTVVKGRVVSHEHGSWTEFMRSLFPVGATIHVTPRYNAPLPGYWVTVGDALAGFLLHESSFEHVESWVEFDTKATFVDVQYRFEQELPE